MDLIVINIVDIVISENLETEEVETQKLYLPTTLHKKDIEKAHPGVTAKGKLYKNITNLKTYSGENYTVVGNYKDINKEIERTDYGPNIGYTKNG